MPGQTATHVPVRHQCSMLALLWPPLAASPLCTLCFGLRRKAAGNQSSSPYLSDTAMAGIYSDPCRHRRPSASQSSSN